ncbi:hypothetical protein KKF84_11485, partial [Myxococcota bacterium]|nr:hypothetical protein [Myxococcota bacterium]MBU1535934.1 hypothetical protein [Myxococcota bacterium]
MKRVVLILAVFTLFAGCKEETVTGDDCGDGVIDTGEECDGDALGGATCTGQGYYGGTIGCSDECQLDVTECEGAGRCGDGVLHQLYGEQCDGSILGGTTCEDLELGAGALACNSICRFDTSGCEFGGS